MEEIGGEKETCQCVCVCFFWLVGAACRSPFSLSPDLLLAVQLQHLAAILRQQHGVALLHRRRHQVPRQGGPAAGAGRDDPPLGKL